MSEAPLLSQRELTHGVWKRTAWLAQNFKLLAQPYYKNLNTSQSEAVDYIFTKLARILNGDPNYQDHWDDIAGYATLESQEIANVTRRTESLRDGSSLAADQGQQTT